MKVKTISQIIFFATAVSLSAGNTYSQGDSVKANNSLKDGVWALQFQIGSNFTLNSFQGTVISGKYHLSSVCAIRAGLSLGVDGSKVETGNRYFLEDTLQRGSSEETSRNSQNFQLDVQYLQFVNSDEEIAFFFGCGPLISLSRTSREIMDFDIRNPRPPTICAARSEMISPYKFGATRTS